MRASSMVGLERARAGGGRAGAVASAWLAAIDWM
jgi:hypothetical protein